MQLPTRLPSKPPHLVRVCDEIEIRRQANVRLASKRRLFLFVAVARCPLLTIIGFTRRRMRQGECLVLDTAFWFVKVINLALAASREFD